MNAPTSNPVIHNEINLDEVAEWVGLHYRVNFSAESPEKRQDWITRYSEAHGLIVADDSQFESAPDDLMPLPDAKAELASSLSDDLANTFIDDPAGLSKFISEGHRGFGNMSLQELLQAAAQADIADRHAKAIQTIEAALAGDLAGMTKVHRTVIQMTVLHDDGVDLSDVPLSAIAHECDAGDYVGGDLTVVHHEPLSIDGLKEAASALGSSASFFVDGSDEGEG